MGEAKLCGESQPEVVFAFRGPEKEAATVVAMGKTRSGVARLRRSPATSLSPTPAVSSPFPSDTCPGTGWLITDHRDAGDDSDRPGPTVFPPVIHCLSRCGTTRLVVSRVIAKHNQ